MKLSSPRLLADPVGVAARLFPSRRTLGFGTVLTLIATSVQAEVTALGAERYLTTLSADGGVAAGSSGNDALVWDGTRAAGQQFVLGRLSGYGNNSVEALSDSGTLATGTASDWSSSGDYVSRAFSWAWANGQPQALSGLTGSGNSAANGISADGAVIVGGAASGDGTVHAVRWQNGTVSDLAGGQFSRYSRALDVSRDGGVIIGYGMNAANVAEAFRWTAAAGMVGLGFLSGKTGSEAAAVSSDGSVVVGNSYTYGAPTDVRAFRWTSAGMTDLGLLPGTASSRATGLSGDGSVVVGYGSDASYANTAFRWTQAGGMQSVAAWLTANGIAPGEDRYQQVEGISRDGHVIVGRGTINGTSQGFLARVVSSSGSGGSGGSSGSGSGAPGSTSGGVTNGGSSGSTSGSTGSGATTGGGVIGLSDFHRSLSGWRGSLGAIAHRYGLSLWGSHHRTLIDSGLARGEGSGIWVTGDYAHDHRSDSRQALGEVGIFRDFGPQWRLGAGFGSNGLRQNLAFNGRSSANGSYLVLEADYAPGAERDWIVSATGLYGQMTTDIRRGYLNGAALDASRGRPDATTWALRLRVDKLNAWRTGAFLWHPFAAYSHLQSQVDAYTESGGGFPVAYQSQSIRNGELRVGAVAVTALAAATDLRLSGELVSARSESGAANGRLLGAGGFPFALAAANESRSWARLGVEVDHRLDAASLLSVSFHTAGQGNDAAVSSSVSWKKSF